MTAIYIHPRDIALGYMDRGWQPIPVPYAKKNPNRTGWENERRTREQVERAFANPRQNLGILMGEPSNGLVDVDQDCIEAIRLAPCFLPKTGLVFGRETAPHTHWLYVADPIPTKTRRYKDVLGEKDGETLVELRSTGGQTIFPPSIHEDTGEAVRWDREREPLEMNGDELAMLVGRLAAATLIARHWPPEGGRHDAALALAGGLLRGGWPKEQAEDFIENVARVAGDNEWQERAKNVETTARRLASEQEAVGWPTLASILGSKVVDRVRDWLGLDTAPMAGGWILSNGKPAEGVSLNDFRAFMPDHRYIFMPSRELWVAASVNGRIPPIDSGRRRKNGESVLIPASNWLDQHRPVEQMTWAPGEPMLIEDRLMDQGGWFDRPGCVCFNLYRPPTIKRGDSLRAGPWLDHIYRVYPGEAEHLLDWLAHRVQRPQEKINHGIVLGGSQGIGKDTLLEPVKYAVGPWNVAETTPMQLLGRFNGFIKSVILRVSEVRDLGDSDRNANRYQLYEHMKTYMAAPPDVLRVDQKHTQEINVLNVCGVIITTNHKTDGLYLPPDDRRHFVAWSELSAEDFDAEYWTRLYGWYEAGGYEHVAAYLHERDLSQFNPKAPPEKTAAFWDIVDTSRAPEDSELADILEGRGWPDVITLKTIIGFASTDLAEWLSDRRSSRQIPHRMESVGYVRVRNPHAKDGLWKVEGKRQNIYGRSELSAAQRVAAAGNFK